MPPGGRPLSPELQERLRLVLLRVPARAVAQRCGCSVVAIKQAASGLPILRGTAALIERGLST